MYLYFLNETLLQILDEKLDWDVTSKIRSLENVRHKAGGGDKKIFDDKEYLRCGSSFAKVVSFFLPQNRGIIFSVLVSRNQM